MPPVPEPNRRPAHSRRPRLPVVVVAAAVPAYLFPAVSAALNALVVPDPAVAARIATAAWTTIAVPSAVAAVLVTLWTHHRTPPLRPAAGTTARIVAAAAAACLAGAAAGSAVLIGNGVLPAAALQFTLGSAAVGGGLAARRWARSGRRTADPAPGSPNSTGPTRDLPTRDAVAVALPTPVVPTPVLPISARPVPSGARRTRPPGGSS